MISELINFRDPTASIEGIVAFGGSLSATNLVRAYRRGIFPWPVDEYILPWCCPEERAIIEFKDLHVPRRLARVQRQKPFRLTIDQAFAAVITACANVERKEEAGTWIIPQMITAYSDLYQRGYAHSVEAWEGDTLVGGLYGVDAGGAFSGESMFCYRSNASKLALLHLIEHLQQRGLEWMDIQMMSPHMEALGARSIHRSEFLARLSRTLERHLILFDFSPS